MYRKLLIFVLLVFGGYVFACAAFAQQNLPAGDYQSSCHACSIVFGKLDCFCEDNNKFPHHTSIVIKKGRDIINNNGQLAYAHRRRRPNPPWPSRRRRDLRNVNAGPIWSQADAESKCPSTCRQAGGRWTGQWHTTSVGRQSVCECRLTRYY